MAKIFIDAGHNYKGYDTGVEGNGLREQDITFAIAQCIGRVLIANGHTVKYSRAKLEDCVGKTEDESLETRCLMANAWGANLFVSVHCNYGGGSGFEVYYDSSSSGSESYAQFVSDEYAKANINLRNNGINGKNKFRVTRNDKVNCPSVLVETAFIDNVRDAEYLNDSLSQSAMGRGIANGIIMYLRSGGEIGPRTGASDSSGSSPDNSTVVGGTIVDDPSYSLMTESAEPVAAIDTSYLMDPSVAGAIDTGYMDALPIIYDKQLSIKCGYLVYFDDVLMNKYVLGYSCSIGVNVGIGRASVELIYTPAFRSVISDGMVEDGIENGTQVRIFSSNVFSDKYKLVFDGIIKQRTFTRDASGHSISFVAVDYIYWMNKIIAPISIPVNEAISPGERLKWKAQSVDPETTAKVEIAQAGSLKGKTLTEYFDTLKEKSFSNSKIYSDSNSAANWDDVVNRVKIMGDINERLVKDEVIDFVVNSNSVFADTVYVSLSNSVAGLMMEMYQDRDGIVRIKPPFWNEPVLKNHIIDPMMIISAQESTDWNKYYTRIIVTGGVEEWMDSGATAQKVDLLTPVGVYVGSLTDKNAAKWADYTSEGNLPSAYGAVYVDDGTSSGGSSGGSGNFGGWVYPLGTRHTAAINNGREFGASRSGGRAHAGIDLLQVPGTAVIACTSGTVIEVNRNFYGGTDAVFFKCDDGHWINFGEISPSVSAGNKINKGDVIGRLKANNVGGSCMLHIEVYKGDFTGSSAILSNAGKGNYLHVEQRDYKRRMDILDPTFIADL